MREYLDGWIIQRGMERAEVVGKWGDASKVGQKGSTQRFENGPVSFAHQTNI